MKDAKESPASALVVLALADVAAIYATALLVTSPAYYGRALLLSLLAFQLMQMFFLRSPALTVVVASSAAYVGLLVAADHRGIFIDWREQTWMLSVFLVVSFHGMILQASANQRLAALVDLFAAAQRGDFTRTFIESRNREPDAITVLGRAYNHMRSELAEIAFTDNLTSCLNRNGFEYALDQMIDGAARDEEEIAILAVDIDHFKGINDSAGHLVGDMVLREVAMLLLDASRAGDVVGTGGRRGVRDSPARRGQRDGGGDRRAADGFDSLACVPYSAGHSPSDDKRRDRVGAGDRAAHRGGAQSESGRGAVRGEATRARSSGAVGARNEVECDAALLEKGVGVRITARSKRPNAEEAESRRRPKAETA